MIAIVGELAMRIARIRIDGIVSLAAQYAIGAAGLPRCRVGIGIPAAKPRISCGKIAIANQIGSRAGSDRAGI
jgi:hypothetical protein